MAWCRRSSRLAGFVVALWLLAVCGGRAPVRADDALHARIDRLVEQAGYFGLSPLADDGQFLRRIYLDLAGRIPPADEARAFLDDPSPDKRAAVIQRLLDGPHYARHMANVFNVMLMERRGDQHVKADQWQQYLQDSFAQNKPWDQLARELLSADGTDEKIRAAAKFYLDREGEPNVLTRDVGRMFFGMDLQCCQCHDHPLIADYYQSDYYGLFAFLNRGVLFTDSEKKVFYAEKAEGDVQFTSVFTQEQAATRPRLPGDVEISEPVYARGDEYLVAPADKVRPVPKYSRRVRLAELATSGRNRAFNRNLANRLWAHMMGRGLVHPVDLHHPGNPPAHPELLDLLADELVARKFDIKALLGELALTRTYQRSLQASPDFAASAAAAAEQLAQLEQAYGQRKEEQGRLQEEVAPARAAFGEANESVRTLHDEFGKAAASAAEAQKKADEATKKLDEAQKALAAKQDVAAAVSEAAAKAKEAAAKLGDDPELTQAAAKFQTRADALAPQVAAAQKSVDQLAAPAQQAQTELAAANENSKQLQQRLQSAHADVGQARQEMLERSVRLSAAQVAALDAKARLESARASVQHAERMALAESSARAYETAQTELVAGRQTLEQAQVELPQQETALAAAQKESDEATAALDQARVQLAAKQEIAQVVGEAAATAELASSKLPDDAEVKQAAQSVKSRSQQVSAEVAELVTLVGQKEQTAQTSGQRRSAAQDRVNSTKQQMAELRDRIPQLESRLPDLQAQAETDRAALAQAQDQLLERRAQQFLTASLEPLTPEQMAWSIMQASGVVAQQQAAARAEVDKTLPLDGNQPDEPQRLAERAQAEQQFVYDKLKGNVDTFVKLFGHAAAQPQADFFATVDQALFFANAGPLQSWLNPGGGNLTDRLNKLEDPALIAEELYLAVLTRRPSQEEAEDVVEYLGQPEGEKVAALKEMAWGLITSAEFRFSH